MLAICFNPVTSPTAVVKNLPRSTQIVSIQTPNHQSALIHVNLSKSYSLIYAR